MYEEADGRRRDETHQHLAASVIQDRWREHIEQRRLDSDSGMRGTGSRGSCFGPSSAAGSGEGSGGNTTDPERTLVSTRGLEDVPEATGPLEERRRACVEEYRYLLEKRKALLEKNLFYQQLLSRHYAEQRRRNGEEEDEATPLTTPDAESAYWALVRQVAEERRSVAGRTAALKSELELQKQRYEPIMNDAAMRERKFQQYIQELAVNVRFMRSNRPIPTATIEEFVEREAAQRSAIQASRVRYLQLKNRLLRLRRVAKGGGASAPFSSSAMSLTTGQGDEEMSAANHHMFLIDFEQLKVENTTLNEKIEERTEEVLKLRNKVTNTIHIATHVREKIDCLRKENAELRQHVASTDEELGGARDQLAKSKRRRDMHLRANKRMKERMPLAGSRDLLLDYEKRKAIIHDHRTRLVQLSDRHQELTKIIKKEESHIVSLQQELSHYPK